MEPAHRGLAPRPLPGRPLVAAAPRRVLDQEPEGGVEVASRDGAEQPRMQNEGFFERIFGSSQPRETNQKQPRALKREQKPWERRQEER